MLEEFEKAIKDIFINKGWGFEHINSGLPQSSWFYIEYNSGHKFKSLRIYRQVINTNIIEHHETWDEKWDEVFKKTLVILGDTK